MGGVDERMGGVDADTAGPALGWVIAFAAGLALARSWADPQRGQLVEYPDRPAVGGRDQLVALDVQVVHGHHRQVAAAGVPARAVVVGDVHSCLRARVQQPGPGRIGPDHPAELAVRDSRVYTFPGGAEIGG